MAQDAQGGRSGSGRSGSRKRRYFRRKPGDGANQDDGAGGAPARSERPARSAPTARPTARPNARDGQPIRDVQGERTTRSSTRRRRKSKGRRSGEGGRDQVAVPQAQEIDYVPPTSVYIYTHIVRPASGGAYEFRAEHFSKVGRTLEDYAVDVTPLFDEVARAAARPNMAELFADFDMGEAFDAPVQGAHMDDSLLAVGGDTGLPTYAEDPYGADDTPPSDEDLPDSAIEIASES